MSRILKGGGSPPETIPPPRPSVVPAPEFDAQRRAEQILEEAHCEAERIRTEADASAAQVRERARDAGHQEGLARATECLAKAYAERDRLLAQAEPEIVEIALQVAEKILGTEVSERGAAVDVVAQALRAVRRASRVRVRVSPADLEALRARESDLVALLTQGAAFELAGDSTVAAGGCLVETESGSVDARLESQLGALRRALLGED